jgi:hypothetical protein
LEGVFIVSVTSFPHRRRGVLLLAVAIAVVGAAIAVPLVGEQRADANARPHTAVMQSDQPAESLLRDHMRKLWEDHIVWTRLAIVSFAAGLPDFDMTAQRLLRNQVDIGNAIKPYYGRRAGNQLTALLKEHIAGAVELLTAAKSGNTTDFDAARAAWYRNGDQIARFLSRANPQNWRFATVRALMRGHLDLTIDEAAARLQGDFPADIRAYDRVHRHILLFADALSSGIVEQFPRRFR